MTPSTTAPGLVVDTDVVSFFFKGDTRAQAYRETLAGHLLAISFMTVAELDRWALARNWGGRRTAALDRHLRAYVVVPFDRALCRAWAEAAEAARRAGRPISTSDGWIAATAMHLGVPLVTGNASDYAGVPRLRLVTAQQAT